MMISDIFFMSDCKVTKLSLFNTVTNTAISLCVNWYFRPTDVLGFAQYDVKWQISGLPAVEYLKRRTRSQTKPKILWRTQNNNYNMTAWWTIWTELIFKYSLHDMYTCCVHISILTSTILAVLFVPPSKIALENCYVYCPPLLLCIPILLSLIWWNLRPCLFQWSCFSVERSERHHQLQDTIPQHSGESTTGKWSEWVLLQVWKNTINTSSNPHPPLLHSRSVKMMCARSSERTREERHQAQTVWHQPVWNPVLTNWPPSSHRSSTDHWSCVKSLPASNTPPSSPSQRNPR